MLHAETEALIHLASERPGPKLRERAIDEAREMVRESFTFLDVEREEIAEVRECLVPGPGGELVLRLYRPMRMTSNDMLLFFHGGGWTFGDIDSHDGLCRTLSNRLGLRAVSVDYRRAPEHCFPAAYLDGVAALDWVATSPAELGEPVTGLVLAGDSAGGNIAAALSANWSATSVAVRAQLLLYPVLDLSERSQSYDAFATGFLLEAADMEWFIANYAPDADLRTGPRASPLHGPFEGTPPTVIVTAGADVLRDEGRIYAARLMEAGVETHFIEAAGFVHGWATARKMLPSAVPILDRALACLGAIIVPTCSSPAAAGKERNTNA